MPHALENLYREHADRVYRAAYRITGRAADAEDVLQTVFLRLMRRDEPEVHNAESYLYRAAINASLDLLRGRRDPQRVPLSDVEHNLPDGRYQTSGEDRELRRLLRAALTKLNPKAAEMFVLKYFEEYDHRQIAKILNTSPAVVAVTLFRTRQQLQKQLEQFRREAR